MKEFIKGKPIVALLGATGLIAAAVIAVTVLVAVLSSGGKQGDSTAEPQTQPPFSGTQLSSTAPNAISSPQTVSETETTTQKQMQQSTTASAVKVNVTGNFGSLNISHKNLRRMIYAACNTSLWHEGEIKGNNYITLTLANYIAHFADDYGLKSKNVWNVAPQVFNDYLSSSNLKCVGALSIDMLNKILSDLYGPNTPTFSYSDFPAVSSRNTAWRIMYADSSYSCGECLILVDVLQGEKFENNTGSLGEFVGFKVENGLISTVFVNLYDTNTYGNEPCCTLDSEIYFAKDSNGNFYFHSVNPDYYETGESSVFGLSKFDGYTFYNANINLPKVCKLTDYLSAYEEEPETTTAMSTKKAAATAQEAFAQVISSVHSDPDFADCENPEYCLIDINKDDTPELIVTGKIIYDSGWYFTKIYTFNKNSGDVTASELLYHYGTVRYSPKYSALVVSELRVSYNYYEFSFYKISNGKIAFDMKISGNCYETEDYVYQRTDSSGNSVEIDGTDEYVADLQGIETRSI